MLHPFALSTSIRSVVIALALMCLGSWLTFRTYSHSESAASNSDRAASASRESRALHPDQNSGVATTIGREVTTLIGTNLGVNYILGGNLLPCATCQMNPSSNTTVVWWKFDEGTGTRAADSSGNGNDGTLRAGAMWNSSAAPTCFTNPYAVTFDGIGGVVTAPSVPSLNFAQDFSGALWIKTTDPFASVAEKDIPGIGDPAWLITLQHLGGQPGQVVFTVEPAGYTTTFFTVVSTIAVNDGNWHHIAWVRRQTTLEVYIDGQLNNSNTSVPLGSVANTAKLSVGGEEESTFFGLTGSVDDFRLFNYALTSAEVQALYTLCDCPNCDDGNACTTDTCNPNTGTCVHSAAPDGTSCNDGNACTQSDTCQAGVCTSSNPVVCTAIDQCHNAGTCDPSTGACSNPAKSNGTSCDDGNMCTQTDTCQAGSCNGANPVICTSSDQCHDAGSCNPANGTCSNPAKPDGTACNDGNACTVDACSSGQCTGTPISCDDSNACTTDICSCTPGSRVFTASGTFQVPTGCSGNVRVLVVGGGGSGGPYPGSGGGSGYVNAGNYTTSGAVAVTVGGAGQASSFGAFVFSGPGANGGGGDNSTGGQGGSSGGGKYGGYPGGAGGTNGGRGGERNNETGNGAASQGSPFPLNGFTLAVITAGGAANNNYEGGGGGGGVVINGSTVKGSDSTKTGYGGTGYGAGGGGGPSGTGAQGVVYVEWGTSVAGGTCSHTPISCDDNDVCTADSCDPMTGCTHTPISCDDNNACTADSCDPASGCTHAPVSCDDGNACTADKCDPAQGCITTPISCDDGNACTADSCDPIKGCVHTPVSCDDGNSCTADSCDQTTGCQHIAVADGTTCSDNGGTVCEHGACTTPTCDRPPANMISWWPAENNTTDIVGGNNLSWVGNANYASGEVATAFSFDGSSWATVPGGSPSSLNITVTEVTLDGWINPSVHGTAIYFGKTQYGIRARTGSGLTRIRLRTCIVVATCSAVRCGRITALTCRWITSACRVTLIARRTSHIRAEVALAGAAGVVDGLNLRL